MESYTDADAETCEGSLRGNTHMEIGYDATV